MSKIDDPRIRIFVYKMTCDNGGAPCVNRGMLSLAICKPMIRNGANDEDWIIGFGSKKELGERLIYIAKICAKKSWRDYSREFARRPDCIYKIHQNGFAIRHGAAFHNDGTQLNHDLGKKYDHHVLLSRNFRYFGKEGDISYKMDFPKIKALVEDLRRGHRVNYSANLFKDLLELQSSVWSKFQDKMKIGIPSQGDATKLCNRDAGLICHHWVRRRQKREG